MLPRGERTPGGPDDGSLEGGASHTDHSGRSRWPIPGTPVITGSRVGGGGLALRSARILSGSRFRIRGRIGIRCTAGEYGPHDGAGPQTKQRQEDDGDDGVTSERGRTRGHGAPPVHAGDMLVKPRIAVSHTKALRLSPPRSRVPLAVPLMTETSFFYRPEVNDERLPLYPSTWAFVRLALLGNRQWTLRRRRTRSVSRCLPVVITNVRDH